MKFSEYKTGKSGKRYSHTWTITDSYEYYSSLESNEPWRLDRKKYVAILKDFFWELSKEIIRSKLEFKIPHRLGFIRIRKRQNNRKLNKQKVDWGEYRRTGKWRYLTNIHTDRHYFYWWWDKRKNRYAWFTNQSYYKFVPNRGNDKIIGTRGLAAWIKECSTNPDIKDYDVLS